ncbi:unnamed protein product [Cuscuta epithymum]|uniref:Uncharacterized protein n=1 Tax=Cuscuta epithymum TaxID=186058 RepID=A0AAV0G164_9ASTE|nr:unnamed protein product [Cuscuta epithymum]
MYIKDSNALHNNKRRSHLQFVRPGLYFKRPSEPMDMFHELHNDESTFHLIDIASSCGKGDIYVKHGLDEVELIFPSPAPTEVVPQVVEEINVNTEEARGDSPSPTYPEGEAGYEREALVESASETTR